MRKILKLNIFHLAEKIVRFHIDCRPQIRIVYLLHWAVVLLKKTTQHVDEPLLVLRVSEEIVLLQCDFHVLCEGDSCSGFPYCSPLVSQVLCRHVVVPIKHDDSVFVLLRHIAAV